MFYIQYLASLCQRRSWAEPVFDTRQSRQGWHCRVRVNNREYTCGDAAYPSQRLACEKAAEAAYLICYNFSVNDGMYPGQRAGQAGVTQGLPVAIGTGRKSKKSSSSKSSSSKHSKHSKPVPALSGGSSPRTSDSEMDEMMGGGGRRGSGSSSGSSASSEGAGLAVCACHRAYIDERYARCAYCLQDLGMVAY